MTPDEARVATAARVTKRRWLPPTPKQRLLVLASVSVLFVLLAASAALALYRGTTTPPANPRPAPGTFKDLAKVVSAINRNHTADDALTRKAARTASGLVPPNAQAHSMRVFTSPVCGPLYVLAAKHGFALISGGGRLGAFGEIVPGTLGEHDPAAGAILFSSDGQGVCGIAIDDVVAVDVVIGSRSYPATLMRNGYYWLAPTRSPHMHALSLRVHLKDGSVVSG